MATRRFIFPGDLLLLPGLLLVSLFLRSDEHCRDVSLVVERDRDLVDMVDYFVSQLQAAPGG